MTDFIGADTQSIVFGGDPQTDLVHLMGRLLRHGHAPTALTTQQKLEANNNPKLIKSLQKRDKAKADIKSQGYPTCAAAKGTKVSKRYETYQRRANNLRKKLLAESLDRAIKEFHETVHAEEVERQLLGSKPSEVLAPSTVPYELPERAQVAHLFFRAAEEPSKEELHQVRMKLVIALAQLCKRRESPCRRQAKRGQKQTAAKQVESVTTIHSGVCE